MTTRRLTITDSRVKGAITRLQSLITEHYPTASFQVFRGEDPEGMYLRAIVDIADTDEVMDLIIDTLYEIQVEQELPVYVVTAQPMERVAAQHAAHERDRARVALPPLSLP